MDRAKIAFFSFADIDNFGDILFSHIFQMEIEKRIPSVHIDFYTPSDFSVEGIKYISYSRDEIIQNKYHALIVFGGEVIHLYDERTWLPIYKKSNKQISSSLPSDVIYNWTDIQGPFKAWVSVGVRPFENDTDFQKTLKAIENLDFVSVRGGLSKKILENNQLQSTNSKIHITPDMGWLFPDLIEEKGVKGKLFKKYIADSEYLVFQINNITNDEAKVISNHLIKFQKDQGIPVYLLPIIRPWDDIKYLSIINEKSNNSFHLLPNNLNILEIADILTHAKFILSSSLHASITGLSAGIPSGIINKWQGTKLQDIFGHQFRLQALKHNIDEIPDILDYLIWESNNCKNSLKIYSEFMHITLTNLFNNLCETINLHLTR